MGWLSSLGNGLLNIATTVAKLSSNQNAALRSGNGMGGLAGYSPNSTFGGANNNLAGLNLPNWGAAGQAAGGALPGVSAQSFNAITQGSALDGQEKIDAASTGMVQDKIQADKLLSTYQGAPSVANLAAWQNQAMGSVADATTAVGGPKTDLGKQLNSISGDMQKTSNQIALTKTSADAAPLVDKMQQQLSSAQNLLANNASVPGTNLMTGAAATKEGAELTSVGKVLDPVQTQFTNAYNNGQPTVPPATLAGDAKNVASAYSATASKLGSSDPLSGVLNRQAGQINAAVATGNVGAIGAVTNNAINQVNAERTGLSALVSGSVSPTLNAGGAAPTTSAIAPGATLTASEKISAASKALDTQAALVAGQAATYTATPNATNMAAFQVDTMSSVKDAAAAVGVNTPQGQQLTGILNQMNTTASSVGATATAAQNAQVISTMQTQLASAQSVLHSASGSASSNVLSGTDVTAEAKHLSGTVAALNPAMVRLNNAALNPTGGDLTAAATNASSVFKSVASQLGPNDPLSAVLTNRASSLDRTVAAGDAGGITLAASQANSDISSEIRGLASLLPSTVPNAGSGTRAAPPSAPLHQINNAVGNTLIA